MGVRAATSRRRTSASSVRPKGLPVARAAKTANARPRTSRSAEGEAGAAPAPASPADRLTSERQDLARGLEHLFLTRQQLLLQHLGEGDRAVGVGDALQGGVEPG